MTTPAANGPPPPSNPAASTQACSSAFRTPSPARRQKKPITYTAVARRAEVSRTFLYENTDARVAEATTHTARQRGQARADHDAEQESSGVNAPSTLKTPSKPPTPRSALNAAASVN